MEDRVKFFSDNASFYQKANDFTAKFAKHALTLVPPITSSSIIHDNASGPGIVSFVITSQFPDLKDVPRIYGTDLAPGMVELFKAQIEEKGLKGRVSAEVMDAGELKGFGDEMFTHSFTHFAIMMEDSAARKVASEVYRTLQPGGTASITTWLQSATALMDRVARRIRPHVEPVPVIPPEWETKEHLVNTLVASGFAEANVEVHLKEEEWEFESCEDRLQYFCHPFWGLFRKGWTESEVGEWDSVMREELGEGKSVKGIAWLAVAKK
jgi:ubiquinone/menaquinone biosynthesis C-methylase UbiE